MNTPAAIKKFSDLFNSRVVAALLWVGSVSFLILIGVALVHGFPFLEGTFLRAKSLRKYYEIAFLLFAVGFVFHPKRKEILFGLKENAEKIAARKETIWILVGIYFLLFLWQNITKYLALDVNFIPYLFYDYMLWYFDQAKFCYTGFLHGYYHVNLILLFLYPIWKVFQSGWVLQVASPLIVACSALPLYCWSKVQLQKPLSALVVAFVFLNFRYVQNLLQANFAVEVFYPLFIFSAVYFASQRRNWPYYLSVALGLLVKEDSPIYFGALALFFLFSKEQRKRGVWTLVLLAFYSLFVLKVYFPLSGSDILSGDIGNFKGLGENRGDAMSKIMDDPFLFVRELFLPLEKVRTFLKLMSKLLFLPLASYWMFPLLIAIYPVYFRGGDQFIQLAFYYGAAVLPFAFLAFVDGWKKINGSIWFQKWPFLQWGVIILLVLLNGMNLRPIHFTSDDIKTIEAAKGIPRDKILITQGHLLPYVGYRQHNFYFTPRYERDKVTHDAYVNPDVYFFDLKANPYPVTREDIERKIEELKEDVRWKITLVDHRRILFEKAMEE